MIEVVSDDELLECLRKVCIESSTWHRKLKRPMLKFQGSKQLCIAKAELLDDVLPKLEEMSFHIAVKDSIRHYVEDLKEHPAVDATHFLFDYKASVCPRLPCYLIQCVFVDFASNLYNH